MNIKKIVKNILLILVFGFCLLVSCSYMFFEGASRLITSTACKQYIAKNYPDAEIINTNYETQVALIIIGGRYEATLRKDDYEFNIVANNVFAGKASIDDFYGSPHFLDKDLEHKIKDFIINHELFKKYEYDESELYIYPKDDEDFITKEKVDKNTLEILTVDICIDFDSKDAETMSVMKSQEKHKLLNDIYGFLKSENIKFQQLELAFSFNATDEGYVYVPDVKESLTKCSNEFLIYQENKELDTSKNIEHKKQKQIVKIIEDVCLPEWEIEDIFVDNIYRDINIVVKNKEDEEMIKSNVRMFFESINNSFSQEDIRNCVLLILKDDIHKNNERHYIAYNRD